MRAKPPTSAWTRRNSPSRGLTVLLDLAIQGYVDAKKDSAFLDGTDGNFLRGVEDVTARIRGLASGMLEHDERGGAK